MALTLRQSKMPEWVSPCKRHGAFVAGYLFKVCLRLAGWSAAFAVAWSLSASPAFARKTNKPLYETPFDLAAGGASLTFAAKEGRLFSNPALLPHGGRFHQWLGSTTTLILGKESVDTVRSIASGKGSSSEDSGDPGGASTGSNSVLDQAFKTPVRIGATQALSWLNSKLAIAGFSRFEADLRALEYGENGMPQIEFRGENYQGVALGTAFRTPFLPWLSLGLTVKGVLASEPEIVLELTDASAVQKFQDPAYLRSLAVSNRGTGYDLGTLIFLQGRRVDWKWAGTVSDVGGTALAGDGSLTSFKQVVSTGLGLTFHTGRDALHFAVDYRDVTGAYEEGMFKRVRVGLRATLRGYVGVAAGFYDGNPSMGAELDLIFLRLAATIYKRELGDRPGVNSREIVQLSLSAGF
jgi:hypothetical protein